MPKVKNEIGIVVSPLLVVYLNLPDTFAPTPVKPNGIITPTSGCTAKPQPLAVIEIKPISVFCSV